MSKQEVIEISGITNQISYFRVIPRQAEEKLAKRKEIKKAVVKKIFPHKIVVTIEEYKTTGYLQKDKKLYPLLENGTMLTALSGSTVPVAAPLLLGFDEEEIIQELSSELIKVSPGIFRSISEIHFNPLPADPLHLVLYMNEGYEVGVTVRNFAEKMEAYPLIIKQLKPEDKVVIHLELGAYIEYLNMGENRNEN
jgi:cell division protein FtsQ